MISNVVKRGIVTLLDRESIVFIKSQVCFDMKRSTDLPNILPSAFISRLTAIANVLNSLNITPGMDAIKDADVLGTDRMKDTVFVAKLDSTLLIDTKRATAASIASRGEFKTVDINCCTELNTAIPYFAAASVILVKISKGARTTLDAASHADANAFPGKEINFAIIFQTVSDTDFITNDAEASTSLPMRAAIRASPKALAENKINRTPRALRTIKKITCLDHIMY